MRIGVYSSGGEQQPTETESHWMAEQLRGADVETVSMLGRAGLDGVQGVVADIYRPTEHARDLITTAHKEGLPVLTFLTPFISDRDAFGDTAPQQTRPYPLAEWIKLSEDAPHDIRVSRGGMRPMMLKVWIQAHFGIGRDSDLD